MTFVVKNINLNTDIESEKYISGLDESAIKWMLLLGYHTHQYIVANNIFRDVSVTVSKDDSQLKYRIEQLQRENVELVKEFEGRKDEMMTECHKMAMLTCEKDMMRKDMTIEHMSSVVEELRGKCVGYQSEIQKLYSGVYAESVKELRESIKEKEMQISMLRNMNSVKGQIGESLLVDTLKDVYPESEVKHMGKVAHVCDVHMVLPDGCDIAFESKYKGTIEKKDVEKFVSDMRGLISEGQTIGGVFVSFLSKNIPGKGCLNFELLDGRPLMYAAYADENEFKLHFASHMKLFEKMCYAVHEHIAKNCNEENDDKNALKLETMIEGAKALCTQVNKNKKRLDDFKKQMLKFYGEMDGENDQILVKLSDMLGHVSVSGGALTKTGAASKPMFSCDACGVTYKSQAGLTKHKKKGCVCVRVS